MLLICPRCGYESEHKHCMQNHYKKKIICEAKYDDTDIQSLLNILNYKIFNAKTFDCEFCKKKFNSCSSKSRHKKICKEKPVENTNNLQSQIDELKKIISNIPAIQNNNITNNTQNNINVTIPKLNDFGRENMNALPETLISTLFMDLRFRELLSNLHCDPNYPENQNVRIKSIKRNTMEIFRNNKWDIMTFTKGLTELLLQGHKIFKDYYKKDKERILEEDMSDDEIKEILNQLEQIEKLSKDELKPLLVDLEMMLEEYRENGSAIVSV
jgi:Fe-S-cluster containining protein